MGQHKTVKGVYSYRGRKLTFEQLAKKAKKKGISRQTLQSRLGSSWSPREAVEQPLGKHRKRAKRQHPEATTWRQVDCSVASCLATKGSPCLTARGVARSPHPARKELAAEDDQHLVPKDWRENLEAIRSERLAEFDRVTDLTAEIQGLLAAGLSQRNIGELLDMHERDVHRILRGDIRERSPALMELIPKTTIRPSSGKREHCFEIRIGHSSEPCGGGWRTKPSPPEEPGHVGRDLMRLLEDTG